MALMYIAKSKDIEKTIEELKVDQQYFRQYLLEEILQQQPEQVRKLLLTASILDRFSRESLAAVSGKENETTLYPDKALFDQLISSTMFIFPLDEEGQWYRFHHFFRDFLSNQLEKSQSREQLAEYHKKASLFFEQNQHFEEAIQHALKFGDIKRVVQIFEQHKHKLLNTDQFGRLEKWLQLIPSELIEQQPQLLLIQAFLQDSKADYQAMQRDLSLAELLLANIPADSAPGKQLWGEFHAINAGLSFYTGNNAGALESSQKALKNLSVQSSYLRIFARAFDSLALQTFGKSGEAIASLKKDLINLHPAQSADRGRILALLSLLYAFEDNLPELLDTALQYRSITLENKLFVTFIMAENRLQQLVELGYSNHKKNLLNQALPLQALFYQKAGNGKKALKIMNKALRLAKPTGHIRNFLDLGAPMQAMIKALYRKRPDDTYLATINEAFI